MTSVDMPTYVDCGVFMNITRESCVVCKDNVGQTTRIVSTDLHEPLLHVGLGAYAVPLAVGGKDTGVAYGKSTTQSNGEGVLQQQ